MRYNMTARLGITGKMTPAEIDNLVDSAV
jgi:hypothetical protein